MDKLPLEEMWKKQMFTTLCEFAPIPEDEWKKEQKKLHTLKIQKSEYFIKAGDFPDKLAFIVQGIFRVFYISESGNESSLVFRDEGRMLSAYSLFLENRNSKYSIQALEDSTLLYMSLKDWTKLLPRHACWQIINAKYSQMLFVEKENRVTEFLSEDAETRYTTFADKFPELIRRIPQYHIASYIGITPEALSRIRKKSKLI
jgi:CRP-like cAMP-binding protein